MATKKLPSGKYDRRQLADHKKIRAAKTSCWNAFFATGYFHSDFSSPQSAVHWSLTVTGYWLVGCWFLCRIPLRSPVFRSAKTPSISPSHTRELNRQQSTASQTASEDKPAKFGTFLPPSLLKPI